MKSGIFAATCAALMSIGGAAQALTVIDFEEDPIGDVADGFVSTDSPVLQFYTDLGGGLTVGPYGSQGDGVSLAVGDDTSGNFLRGVFTDGAHSFLSMTLGNDDPAYTNDGDRAVLTVYLGDTLVGSSFVLFNRNDLMDQTVGFMFGSFDNFTLAYTDADGNPFTGGGGANTGLVEIVDNVSFDSLAIVPEPAAWAMMIAGFGGVGAVMRGRRRLAPVAA